MNVIFRIMLYLKRSVKPSEKVVVESAGVRQIARTSVSVKINITFLESLVLGNVTRHRDHVRSGGDLVQ